MPSNKNIPTDQHLQSALYGTPKVNPDEQRKYLGTFRERVSLTISVAQLEHPNWVSAFKQEIAKSQSEIVFFNGNIEQSQLKPYILAATKAGINFTIKTNPDYHVADQNLAIVVAAKKAIHINPIDVTRKYSHDQSQQKQAPQKLSFWQKIFNKH